MPFLRDIPRKKLMEEVRKVDKVLSRFNTHSVTKTNELFYAGTVVVTNRLEVKEGGVRREPMWKLRLEKD